VSRRAALVLVCLALALARPAGAQLDVGTWDVALKGVYASSFNFPRGAPEIIETWQAVPHVGYVLTAPAGPSLLEGSLELVAEPTLMSVGGAVSATTVGVSVLSRWIFTGVGGLRPYVEGGIGALAGQMDIRASDCAVNFLLQGGVGSLYFLTPSVALSAGYRFQHLSNASLCSRNLGINSNAIVIGVHHFFR
jgi:hypothetical protein